jgi:hypothetical protein
MSRAVFVASLALDIKLAGPYTAPLLCSAKLRKVSSALAGKGCLFILAMYLKDLMHREILPPLASQRGDSGNKLQINRNITCRDCRMHYAV